VADGLRKSPFRVTGKPVSGRDKASSALPERLFRDAEKPVWQDVNSEDASRGKHKRLDDNALPLYDKNRRF